MRELHGRAREEWRGGQGVQWKNTLFQADEGKRIGCKWPFERRSAAVREDCAVTGPYCEECENRSLSREKIGSESAPSGAKEGEAAEESDFAGELGKAETERDR